MIITWSLKPRNLFLFKIGKEKDKMKTLKRFTYVCVVIVIVFGLITIIGSGGGGGEGGNNDGSTKIKPDAPASDDKKDYIPRNAKRLIITPGNTFKLALGGEIDLKVQVFDENNNIVANTNETPVIVTWASDNNSIVTVNEAGIARGEGEGTAVISAQVRGVDVTTQVTVQVEFSDVTSIYLNPSRISLDIGGSRWFDATAVDYGGAPTTLDCIDGANLEYNDTYLSATYDDTIGSEKINVSGIRKGYSMLSLECGGFMSSPAVIEVKPSVSIPDPSPSANGDFGINPSFIIDDDQIHIASYDQANKKLIYTYFQRVWNSEIIDGEGEYGYQNHIVLDPLNENQPIIFAIERWNLSCWRLDSNGYWVKHVIEKNIFEYNRQYEGKIRAAVSENGEIYVLYYVKRNHFNKDHETYKVSVSKDRGRNDWSDSTVARGGGLYGDITIAPDDKPRIAFQYKNKAYYGAINQEGTWIFELIDGAGGIPSPGTGIRLAIGSDNRPQAVYYKNGNLIHAIKINGSWVTSTIETVSTAKYEFGLDLNRHNQPRVSYYDSNARTLRYAYRLHYKPNGFKNRWRIDTPISYYAVGIDNALLIDKYDRSHIVYYNQSRHTPGYYVEPNFLDYSSTNSDVRDPITNIDVTLQDTTPCLCPYGTLEKNNNPRIDTVMGYSQINDTLRISGSIDEIKGLECLTRIQGSLDIYGTDLVTLKGLENLTTIGGLNIGYPMSPNSGNDDLVNLSGLENLVAIGTNIGIADNGSLGSIDTLKNAISNYDAITSVPKISIRRNHAIEELNFSGVTNTNRKSLFQLEIVQNNSLESIDLAEITELQSLNVSSNVRLESVIADNVIYMEYGLDIYDNDLLEGMSFESLEYIGHALNVRNNDILQYIALANLTYLGVYLRINDNNSLNNIMFESLSETRPLGLPIEVLNNPILPTSQVLRICERFERIGNSRCNVSGNGQ